MPAPAHVAPLDLAQARLCLSKLIRQRGHLKPEMHNIGRFRSRLTGTLCHLIVDNRALTSVNIRCVGPNLRL